MEQNYCLNCSEEISKHFCPNCGQKTNTHRITLKHFFMHDLLHGVWHIERGMLYTLKETFKRPGQAALDYIGGKRVRYYNVFYLGLLLLGLNLLLSHFFDSVLKVEIRKEPDILQQFASDYVRFIIFGFVPLFGLNAALIFKRLKLNLAEHMILAGISLLGILCLNMVFLSFDFMTKYFDSNFLGTIESCSFFVMALYPVWSYYDAIKGHYRAGGILWRIFLFYVMILAEFTLLLLLTILILTGNPGFQVNVDL